MKNILSYQNREFSGKEILEWAQYQVDNNTSHSKQGARILKYFNNLHLDRMYLIDSRYRTYACYDEGYTLRKQPIVYRIR